MIAIGKSINFDLSFIQPLDSNEKTNEEAHKETKQSSRKKKDVHYNIPLDFDNVLDSTIHNTIPMCLNIEIDLTKLHETEEEEERKEVVDNYKSNLHLSQLPTIGSPIPTKSIQDERDFDSPPPFNPQIRGDLPVPNSSDTPPVFVPSSQSDKASGSGSSSTPFQFQEVFPNIISLVGNELDKALMKGIKSTVQSSLPVTFVHDVEAITNIRNEQKEKKKQSIKFELLNDFVEQTFKGALFDAVSSIVQRDANTARKASDYIEKEEQTQQPENKTVVFPRINIFTNNSLSEALISAIKQSVAHSEPNL